MNLIQIRNYLLELDVLYRELSEIEMWLSNDGWFILDGKKYHTLLEDGKPNYAAINEVKEIKKEKEYRIKFIGTIRIS